MSGLYQKRRNEHGVMMYEPDELKRRDFNAEELAMIKAGKLPEAKVAYARRWKAENHKGAK